MSSCYIYRAPTKLWEDNIFISVCQSFCRQWVGIPDPMSFLGVVEYLWSNVPFRGSVPTPEHGSEVWIPTHPTDT